MAKTVMICSNLYPPEFMGGAELIASEQAKALQRMGHRVVVFAGMRQLRLPHYALVEDSFDGIPVYRVQLAQSDFDSGQVSYFHPQVERHFENLVRQYQPDVTHMHNLTGLSVGMLTAAKRSGCRVVLTLHDFWGFCVKATLIDFESRVCRDFSRCEQCQSVVFDGNQALPIRTRNNYIATHFSAVDAFISPSRYLAAAYVKAGIPADKMHVIRNGVDVERFSRIQKEPAAGLVRFTFIGYLGEHKGVRIILQALNRLRNRPRLHLNVVGDGHLRFQLEQEVHARGHSGRVKFWGQLPHDRIEDAFRNTDVLLLPSIWPENQPVTITEAMACRTPVIASCLGGVPELVRDGETGYLIEPGSSAALARAMRQLLDHPHRIATFGERAGESISENTLSKQIEHVATLYDAGLAAPSYSSSFGEERVERRPGQIWWATTARVSRAAKRALHDLLNLLRAATPAFLRSACTEALPGAFLLSHLSRKPAQHVLAASGSCLSRAGALGHHCVLCRSAFPRVQEAALRNLATRFQDRVQPPVSGARIRRAACVQWGAAHPRVGRERSRANVRRFRTSCGR